MASIKVIPSIDVFARNMPSKENIKIQLELIKNATQKLIFVFL